MTSQSTHHDRIPFLQAVAEYPILLAEGSIIEKLAREGWPQVRGPAANASLLFDRDGREALRDAYREYLEVGRKAGLPLVLLTPTWRANAERLARAGLPGVIETNREAVRLLKGIAEDAGEYAKNVYIGGLMGCYGDAYRPEEALSEREAYGFHREQASALANAGVDFLMAATLPEANEAAGIARAMAETGVPAVPSYVIRRTGEMLDGTPLVNVVRRIDSVCQPSVAFHMVNCVHPDVFTSAMETQTRIWPELSSRILGLQANTSPRSPEELDGLDHVDGDGPDPFTQSMLKAQRNAVLRILGGCCGTSTAHLSALAEGITLPRFE
ncbi:MAG: homocysteine S-methyltransferase family protein [bacterium]